MFFWSITTTACAEQKKKTSVGIVSPYAAQVISLQERVQSYEKYDFLSVEVCTVDSCQGAEKDINPFNS
jgi:superfamily I DNA and/or RNA helicase